MATNLNGQLVVAISSRALFDFEQENEVFEQGDDRAYMDLQLAKLDEPAKPGVAFSLVQKLLAFNSGDIKRVEVVILSRNDPVSGLRVFRSAQTNDLKLERGVFTRGRPPYKYLSPLQANLFLSANPEDVKAAVDANFAAATVATSSIHAGNNHPNEVRIAFDGDAVLFSDEAEKIYQNNGSPDLLAFEKHETQKNNIPLPPGPFKPLLEALHRLQKEGTDNMRIRTALVTARGSKTADRAIKTLMKWNIQVDEAMFLGGLAKGEFLKAFEPDFFFDDQTGHVKSAAQHVPAGHVPSGVSNK